jgi:ATP-dependent Clp protease ATP-binding subunit ClpA
MCVRCTTDGGKVVAMFERFDEQARLSVVLADHVATDRGADYIHTGHILLGLRASDDEVTTTALDEVGMPTVPKPPTPPLPRVYIPFNPEAKAALERASEEAKTLVDHDVRPGHILLAILPTEPAVAELAKSGIDANRLRDRVMELLGH